jgi:dihydrofolate reductase
MRLVATEYVSVDGVMDEPGKWSFPFWSEEASQFKAEELAATDALLLGRITYEGFAAAWPTMQDTGEFGERMNSIKKYVVSTTLKDPTWTNTTVIDGDVVDEIKKLRAQPGKDLLLSGSGTLVRSLIPHDVIDEYRLMVYPIVLGQGKRLFNGDEPERVLQLTGVKQFASGVTVLSYVPKTD